MNDVDRLGLIERGDREVERAGWVTEHPVTGKPIHVVTREWFMEERLQASVLRDQLAGAVEASAKVVAAWDAYLSDTDDEDDTTWCALRDAIDALRAGGQ
jgi:hypothetical protein